jgi:hypothetical protein
MPLQNRVTPFGDIVAVPDRGAWLGNRGGCFHTPDRRLKRRPWAGTRWLVCVLDFRGRHREVMSPGLYTELFFLDEATALAAGHRPCKECRRDDHERFKAAWGGGVTAVELDDVLHRERLTATGAKCTFTATLAELPDGVFVTRRGEANVALLVSGGRLWRWSPAGYADAGPRGRDMVTVLTPRSTVRAIAAGYAPQRHPSGG